MAKTIETASAAEVLGSNISRIKDEVAKALGDKAQVRIGPATIIQTGYEFTEGGKRETIWVVDELISSEAVGQALVGRRGVTNMTVAYKARDAQNREVFLSKYHTQRVFGKAPQLRINDVVDVYAVSNPKSESKFAFAYQPLKGV